MKVYVVCYEHEYRPFDNGVIGCYSTEEKALKIVEVEKQADTSRQYIYYVEELEVEE